MSDSPNSYKIIVAGDSGTGKTALVRRLVEGKFYEDIQSTIGVEFKSFNFYSNYEPVKLQIWDTSGQERFMPVSKAYFRNSLGAILVFDLTYRKSFDNLSMWINDFRSICNPNAYIILVGSKSDMENDRQISETEAQIFADQNQVRYFEASSKTGFNVNTIFKTLGEEIFQHIKNGDSKLPEKVKSDVKDEAESNKESDSVNRESDHKGENEFSLSPQNLFDFPFDKYEQDFTFIVDGQQFKTSRIVAEILSPTIRDMHLSDPTIDEFAISTKKNIQQIIEGEFEGEKYFTDFLKLCSFRPIIVDDDAQLYFATYFILLGNKNEFSRMIPNLSPQEAILFLGFDNVASNDLTSFVASYFYSVDLKRFSNLPLSTIEQILFDENLVINDEDSFLSFIIELYEKDPSFSILFGAVCFTNVNKPVLKKFVEKFMIEDIDTNIWRSICHRLLNSDVNGNNNNNENNENKKRYYDINSQYISVATDSL